MNQKNLQGLKGFIDKYVSNSDPVNITENYLLDNDKRDCAIDGQKSFELLEINNSKNIVTVLGGVS